MKKDYSRERNATIDPMQEVDDKALNQPGLRMMVSGDGGLSCGAIDCSAVQRWCRCWYLRRSAAGTGALSLLMVWGLV